MNLRRTLPLDRWTVLDFDPGAGDAASVDGEWIEISAPGDIYSALVAAGRLAHPFKGRNETEAAWVRDREWWWRTTFEAPSCDDDQVIQLVFEGLDTFAEVFLDGVSLGRTDNMFRTWRYDLAPHVAPGKACRLAIRFDPPALVTADLSPLPVWSAFNDRVTRSRRNLMRKAQFGWGWDWGPDLPTVGVWRPASLQIAPRARLADFAFTTLEVSETAAHAEVRVELSEPARRTTLEVVLTDPDGVEAFAWSGPARDRLPMRIDSPRLWWTADQGDQPLYDLTLRLRDGARVVDEACRRVGLRTIAIDQSPDPDEPGSTFFRFVLNGRPIFARGACWVPTTSFVAEVDEAAYRRLIRQAAEANMNMIRVWGGGVYEPDLFYDLCDEHGVLVWQDFMFACAHYPEDEAFVASVRAEVEDQVRRLRHHPCLGVWCGNNENMAMHRINAEMSGDDAPLSGAVLFETMMPEWLDSLDPTTPYWPGSPWGGAHPNGMKAGDVHDWTVWHGVPPIPDDRMIEGFGSAPDRVAFTRYAEDMGRFISEFGVQAAPSLDTLARWMDPADLSPDSQDFHERIKDEARKADALMAPVTGQPTTIRDYIDFSQWTQAEGLKFGIEHFRRRRPHCSGALIWQFNDCWPCVSWSLVDYDGVEKAAYYAVRRAFAPLLASFETAGDQVALWLSNDLPHRTTGDANISLETLDGQVIWRRIMTYDIAPDGHTILWHGPEPKDPTHLLRVWSENAAFPPNRMFGAAIKHLPLLSDQGPHVQVDRRSDTELSLVFGADTYLPFVHLTSAQQGLRFSDNYFDMAAGDTREVSIMGKAPLSLQSLSVRSWNSRISELS